MNLQQQFNSALTTIAYTRIGTKVFSAASTIDDAVYRTLNEVAEEEESIRRLQNNAFANARKQNPNNPAGAWNTLVNDVEGGYNPYGDDPTTGARQELMYDDAMANKGLMRVNTQAASINKYKARGGKR